MDSSLHILQIPVFIHRNFQLASVNLRKNMMQMEAQELLEAGTLQLQLQDDLAKQLRIMKGKAAEEDLGDGKSNFVQNL